MKLKDFQVKTGRLMLRAIERKDATQFATLAVSYRSTGKIDTEEKARKFIDRSHKAEDKYDLGIFLQEKDKENARAKKKKTNSDLELIGTIELCHMSWFDFTAAECAIRSRRSIREKDMLLRLHAQSWTTVFEGLDYARCMQIQLKTIEHHNVCLKS